SLRQSLECALAEHRAQAGEILVERIEQAIPVAAAVDLQAFERRQTVIRLDVVHGRFGIDVVARDQRAHQGSGHALLEREQAHGATGMSASLCFVGAAMYFSALRASACTSPNDGMRSSHSSSVAVGPTRRMACS